MDTETLGFRRFFIIETQHEEEGLDTIKYKNI